MVGAGEMASCCLLHLQKKGECSITVANRSLDRAQALAEEFNGSAVPFTELYRAMADADVVISSTGSPTTVINRDDLEPVMKNRSGRSLVIIDIAVPRDVDPEVASIDGVHLHDIDALESTVQQTLGRWEKDLEMCEIIIKTEIESLMARFESRRVKENIYHEDAETARAV
jgi:glutamyl-tRNA reductase